MSRVDACTDLSPLCWAAAAQSPFSGTVRLWLLYHTWIGQLLLLLPMTWWVLSWQHHRIARHADSPESKQDIPKLLQVRETLRHSTGTTRPMTQRYQLVWLPTTAVEPLEIHRAHIHLQCATTCCCLPPLLCAAAVLPPD